MNFLRLPSRPVLALVTRRPLHTSCVCASGHNKWSKIKGVKGANDRARGQILNRVNKDITIAVRTGGGSVDPETNVTLAAVLRRLKSQGVPKDNVESALKRAAGERERGDQQLVYEALAPGSVGMIIECQTDNVNRTLHTVRHWLTDDGARLAPVKFMFTRHGLVSVALENDDSYADKLETLIEKMMDAGAEDFATLESEEGDAEISFTCQPEALHRLTSAATESGLCKELLRSDLVYTPIEKTTDLDEGTLQKVDKCVDHLERCDDVLQVWTTLGE
ncbi:YebC-like protein [Daedalea quercina L-15889]|uniref:YebC-like protein n=1 Tax=Daedalea quercina L-15889 TaxID=1314783 RepID=A0A165MBM4_9APHY|nr:YebC-like protein [Daedalea quercina L-15889]